MRREAQISAFVSKETRELMEKYSRATGVKKAHLIEQALLHHLQALEAIPTEYVVRPRIVVSHQTGKELLRSTQSAKPTQALRDLMRDGD